MDTEELKKLVGDKVLVKTGADSHKEVAVAEFAKEIGNPEFLGFYFGAHWAPPCRLFTTNLAEFYSKVNKESKVIEIVFVKEDREKGHFERNFNKMPWASIPYDSDQVCQTLKSKYGVADLPTLVIVSSKDFNIVSHQARDSVSNADKALKEWRE